MMMMMMKYVLQEAGHLLLAPKGGTLVHGNRANLPIPHGLTFDVHHTLILQPQTYTLLFSN